MSSSVLLKMNLHGFLTVIAWKSSQAQPKDISHDTDSLDLKLYCVPLDRQERRNKPESSAAKALLLASQEDPKPGKWRCFYNPQRDVSAPDMA